MRRCRPRRRPRPGSPQARSRSTTGWNATARARRDYTRVCASGQTYARYITVTIQKMFTPMFGSRYFPRANANGTYTLTGQAGLRTQ